MGCLSSASDPDRGLKSQLLRGIHGLQRHIFNEHMYELMMKHGEICLRRTCEG